MHPLMHDGIMKEVERKRTGDRTWDRGLRAARLMGRILRGEVRPRQALTKPPMLWNIVHQNTFAEPLLPITQASMDLEKQPGILAASVACGYQYNDVPHLGPSVVVVTDDDPTRAARLVR